MPAAERTLPSRPSLEQQQKQAKELIAAYRAGDAAAQERLRRVLPDKARFTLADAQLALAREYGFQSWRALAAHIAERRGATHGAASAEEFRSIVRVKDAGALRAFLRRGPEARALVDLPLFAFDAPALVHAAPWGDVALIDALLDAGADPNRRSGWWAGPFHALHRAEGAVAQRLLAAGAVPDACAAANLDRPDLLRSLLDADPGRVNERGGDGQTPLHFARSRTVVDLLLERGADVDARDRDHRSSPAEWMLAGRRGAGRYELARYLVERGATADVFLAAALGLGSRLRDLLAEEPSLITERTGRGRYGEHPPSSFHIYTWTIGQDVSPLQAAAQFEQPDAVAVLVPVVTADAVVLADELSAAAGGGHVALLRAVLEGRPDAARLTNSSGSTALHAAAAAGRADCCRLLLQHGADGNARDRSDHAAPLHYAAEAGHLSVIELLVEAGVDVAGAGDEHRLGVLGWATCLGRVRRDAAEYLLARGAPLGIFPAISLGRIDDVRRLVDADAVVLDERMNSADMDLRTPLHHAVDAGNAAIVELLLRAGADPNAGNASGARPASYVRAGAERDVILELLTRYGAEPDDLITLLLLRRFDDADAMLRSDPEALTGPEGRPTPLHEAVHRQDGAAVDWLIARGADLNAIREMGSCGVTPLHVAAADDAAAMARRLLDAGADPTVRDTRWNAAPLGWADYLGSRRVRAVLAGEMAPDGGGQAINETA